MRIIHPKDGNPERYLNYDIAEAVITKGRVSAKILKRAEHLIVFIELFIFIKISGKMVRQ